jgi:ferritin-like metal-binding protein YciE
MANTKTTASKGQKPTSKASAAAATKKAPAKPAGKNESTQLDKYFTDSLKDIYWAEKHLTKVLPKMKKAATNQELKDAIEDHLGVTEEHVSRLEQVFKLLGKTAQAKKCDAMEGLTKEGDSIVEETEDGSNTRDVGIIMAAQKVEHYEIATYGALVQLAKTMGNPEVADILAQTLAEEKQADEGLTEIAENNINWEATQDGAAEEED